MYEKDEVNETSKQQQLENFKVSDTDQHMTTNQGLKISEDELSLTAGERGPTLMEDFHFREKMTHFDHERIPERVVHARGFGVHGEFEAYESMEPYTKAKFLGEAGKKTPVFVRFSTVVGSRGSADTVRDVRGFATKFYTEEGNYDLVNNIHPVFFIQDAIKFPDIVHAIKPEPHNDIPQATAAHDTLWDFVVNNQETANQIMWLMSPRGVPRSYRMMEGFSINTFRFVNKKGVARFIRLHWKPKLGVHSLVWDEAQKINGKDPDFHRRDLYDAIKLGNFVEYELGVQMIEEKDEFAFDFDILDATKFWPEEEIPVEIIGKMTLNKNVDNFFTETEQIAFHPGHVVPGIDFSNDPLLQGRLFSYTDTQLIRLGGPNFHELPINRPVVPFYNNQREGYNRQTINKGRVAYHKNSLARNTPTPVSEEQGGYAHYQEKIEGKKVRQRSASFADHFSQATIFWNSLSDPERKHIVDAFSFEVGHVKDLTIRQKVVDMFANVDTNLATQIAQNIGVTPPTNSTDSKATKTFPSLSQLNTVKSAATRKVGVILDHGFNDQEVMNVLIGLAAKGVTYEIISEKQGMVKGREGKELEVNHTFSTTDPVLYDAIFVAIGAEKNSKVHENTTYYVKEAYKHYKPIAASQEGRMFLEENNFTGKQGVVDGLGETFVKSFIEAIAQHRHWDRQMV